MGTCWRPGRSPAALPAAAPRSTWVRWIVDCARDERGQDLIEYALLTAAVGVAGIATWPFIAASIGTAYRALDTNTQGLWEPPPPGGAP
jgi:Flp pilus assembly pilin Flp